MKSWAPELYALLHRGHPGDLAYYAQICSDSERVLELGCGYGRVAWALAQAGHEVVGLDRDEQLLALARRSAPEPPELAGRVSWVAADMCDFQLEGRFERVLIVFNTLCCLLSVERVAACLASARRHLSPNGAIVLDVYNADPMHEHAPADGPDDPQLLIALEHDGGMLDVYEQSDFQPSIQRLDTSYHFVPRNGGTPFVHTIAQRYLLLAELETLVREAGLQVNQLHGGFAGEPLDDDAEHIVLLATLR
jgi:SAM-dependent methyltransferase